MTAIARSSGGQGLPPAMRQGVLDDLDWKTTFIAAFSFLFHFGAVAATYSDFTDGVIRDDGARVDVVVESLANISSPPIEAPAPPSEDGRAEASRPRPGPATPVNRGGAVSTEPTRSHRDLPRGEEKPRDARVQSIKEMLAAEGDAMRLAIGGRGNGATDRVLAAGGDLPLGRLDGAAPDPEGVRLRGAMGLSLGGGPGVVRPGQIARWGDVGEGEPWRDPAATVDKNVGTKGGPKRPTPTWIRVDWGWGGDGPWPSPPNPFPVIARLRARFRACYNRELASDPSAKGTVRLTATIGPNGEVQAVQTAVSGTLSASLVACLSAAVHGAVFEPPDGGRAMVTIPVSFLPQ